VFVDIKRNGVLLKTLDIAEEIPHVMIEEEYVGRIARYYFLRYLISIGFINNVPREYSYLNDYESDSLFLCVNHWNTRIIKRDITAYIHSDVFPTDDERDNEYREFQVALDAAYYEYLEELGVFKVNQQHEK